MLLNKKIFVVHFLQNSACKKFYNLHQVIIKLGSHV